MKLKNFGSERGATAIEYGLIASLLVLVTLAGMQQLGGTSNSMYGRISNQINAAVSPGR